MIRFGVGTAVSTSQINTISISSLIPVDFDTLSEETYLADNLYEKINGKAPLYIESGFVKPTDRVVVFITGSGYKYLDVLEQFM